MSKVESKQCLGGIVCPICHILDIDIKHLVPMGCYEFEINRLTPSEPALRIPIYRRHLESNICKVEVDFWVDLNTTHLDSTVVWIEY